METRDLDDLALEHFSAADLERFANVPAEDLPRALREASYGFAQAFETSYGDAPTIGRNHEGELYVEAWNRTPAAIPQGEPAVDDVPMLDVDDQAYGDAPVSMNSHGDPYVQRF